MKKETKEIQEKRKKEIETVSSMIEIYCHGSHGTKKGALCEQCENIVFSDVAFAYEPEKPVLKGISFTAKEGEFTALVGVSGCGKSTAESLMMGEGADAFSGTITVGGVDIREIASDALYKKITRVRHDSYLFAGTVRENLCMGCADATVKEMENALKAVDLYDTVSEKGGLSMEITEKASNLSGGQKQRLANVVEADQILVMKDGVIEESGVHTALMEKNGYYSRLYETQQELERYAKEAV